MKYLILLLLLVLAACAGEARPLPAPPTVPPAPSPSASPSANDTRLATFFFYWYHCPTHECDAAQLSVVPPGWLAPLPADADPRDGTAYSALNYDWYASELQDMQSVGIDMLFPVSWGDHPHFWFRQETLRLLVQANAMLDRPIPIGMFLDTTAQQAMYSDFSGNEYRFGPTVPKLPLSDERSGYFFYDRHIKGFFEQIPREMWATVDGRPLIVSYTALCCDNLELSGALWGAVADAFTRDFGVRPFLIIEDTWFGDAALNPPTGRRAIDAVADARYSWGTALNGPRTHTLKGFTVSSVGPGFDNSRITNIADPRVRSRDDGAFLRQSLAEVPADADLLFIETWNEWPESTGVARATHRSTTGQPLPEDFYLQIIREWRALP